MLRTGFLGLAGLALAGCAQPFMKLAQSQRAAFGFSAGSVAYADCVQKQVDMNVAAVRQALVSAGTAMKPGSGDVDFGPASPIAGGTFRATYVSGERRVCISEVDREPRIRSISAAETCPMM